VKYLFLRLSLLLITGLVWGQQGTVESISFASANTPPPAVLPAKMRAQADLFRLGLHTLPEHLLVVGASRP